MLRTFSKAYGLAGLRVGYVLASPEIAEALQRVRPIFNVSAPAQAAALASLEAQNAVAARVAHARAACERLRESLSAAGLHPVASQAKLRLRGRARGGAPSWVAHLCGGLGRTAAARAGRGDGREGGSR